MADAPPDPRSESPPGGQISPTDALPASAPTLGPAGPVASASGRQRNPFLRDDTAMALPPPRLAHQALPPTERGPGPHAEPERGSGFEDGSVPGAARSVLLRRVLLTCTAAGLLTIIGLPLLGLAVIHWYGRGAEAVDLTPLAAYDPPKTIRVLARDGEVLGEIGGPEHRDVVPLREIPDHVVEAFLAAEDAEFFDHGATSPRAMLRATVANVAAGELRQGASTITQQTVKNVLLTHERTVERKSKEILLAARVERELGKRHILEVYLNEIYLGEGRYGVQAASRHYFGRDVADIDLGQAAILASLPKAPSAMSPYRAPERLKARRDWVLQRMVDEGFVEARDIEARLGTPLDVLEADAPRYVDVAPEIVDAVAQRLSETLSEDELARLGGTVETTIDVSLQRHARAAAIDRLEHLERAHGYGGQGRALSDEQRAKLREQAPERLEVGDDVVGVVHSTSDDAGLWIEVGPHTVLVEIDGWRELDAEARRHRFPPGGRVEAQVSDDGTTGRPRAVLGPGPEVALVLMEVDGARVRALIGGRSYGRGEFDRARRARRQPGSAFKPFVYGAALAGREHTAATARTGEDGEVMTLRRALARSDNAVAARVLEEVVHPKPQSATDYAEIQHFAGAAGIDSPLRPHPSLALGTSELTPLELATAYGTLARGGVAQSPRLVERLQPAPLLTPEGPMSRELPGVLRRFDGVRREAIDSRVAFVLTDMMTSVIEQGTARAARDLDRPVAGKTGTTDDAKDGWFVGFTPGHVAAVWVGFDQPRSLGRHEHGSSTALPIWRSVMAQVIEEEPSPESFDVPPGVHRATIDERNGTQACHVDERWWTDGWCTEGWFFRSCQPASLVAHPRYLRCADPNRWRREWFIDGTDPGDHRRAATGDPGVHIVEVGVFDAAMLEHGVDADDRSAALASAVERLRNRIEHEITPLRASSTGANPSAIWGAYQRVHLRVDAGGFVRTLRTVEGGPGAGMEAAVFGAIARACASVRLPDGLLDPHTGESDLIVEIRWGDIEQVQESTP